MCLLLLTATIAKAQSTSGSDSSGTVPQLVRFTGVLKDDLGHVKTGMVGVTFALYKEQDGGTPLWLEMQNIEADSEGKYSVLLGSTKTEGLPAELFSSNEPRWLGVQLEGQAEQPRLLFVSVPYALRASDAATFGGLPPSAFVRANSQGGASSDGKESADKTVPEAGSANTPSSLKNVQTSGGKANFLPLWTNATTIGNSALSQSGSDVTLSGNLFLQKGNLNAAEGQVLGQTGFFQSNNEGSILSGTSTNSAGGAGVTGVAEGTSGVGVQGSGVTGVSGFALSDGTGVFGEGGTGVFGEAFNNLDFVAGVSGLAGPGGINAGVQGQTESPKGTGVLGVGIDSSNTGNSFVGCCTFGVWGDTDSQNPFSAALMGTADEARAMFLQNNSVSTTAVINDQIDQHGVAILSVNGLTFKEFCNFNTDGVQFCTGGQSLVVPVDNSQRQVALHAVESPENWFEDFGSGSLENGVDKIALEPIFAQTVNTGSDYHVFLTPEGECRGLYISNKSASGFEVHELGGGQSNVAFSYRIVALRRGYENARLEDETAMVAQTRDNMPRLPATPAHRWPAPGSRFKLPSPPPAAQLVQPNAPGVTQVNAPR